MSYAAEKKIHCTSDELETLPEETAAEWSDAMEEVNGHNVYFIPFDDYKGYSCIVYRGGRIMPYAGDSQSRHKDMYRKDLRAAMLRRMQHTLFTDEQIVAPLKDYSDYQARSYYLHNHFGCMRDHVSIFRTPVLRGSKEDIDGQREFEQKTKDMVYDPIAFAFFNPEDREFVVRHCKLYNELHKREEEKKDDFDYWLNAFIIEMNDHEYPINYYQGNWDTLSAFGNIEYDREGQDDNLTFYFDQLKFNDTQRRAYRAARSAVLSSSDY